MITAIVLVLIMMLLIMFASKLIEAIVLTATSLYYYPKITICVLGSIYYALYV